MNIRYFLLVLTVLLGCFSVEAVWKPKWWTEGKQRLHSWRPRIGIHEETWEKIKEVKPNVTLTPNLTQMLQQVDEYMTLDRAVRYGGIAALFLTAGYYGPRLAWNSIEKKLLDVKPDVIDKQAHPKYGRWDRLARWWSGYQTPSVVFVQKVQDYLLEIQERTKNIRDHIFAGDTTATYTNLLLYGPPGTGKTLFARVLADYTDMDFLPTTAENILRSSTAFDELLEMANNSAYGVIIFIDEVDALFIDRTKLLQSTAPEALAQYRLVNNILGKIGQRNNKFMIVAATNLPQVMDEAMERRFSESVEMPLPDTTTRFALLYLYCGRELFNEKTNSKKFIKSAQGLLTLQFMKKLAEQLEGFSPAKIENLIIAMKDATRSTKDGMLKREDVNNAIERAMERHKKGEESKKAREKLFGGG